MSITGIMSKRGFDYNSEWDRIRFRLTIRPEVKQERAKAEKLALERDKIRRKLDKRNRLSYRDHLDKAVAPSASKIMPLIAKPKLSKGDSHIERRRRAVAKARSSSQVKQSVGIGRTHYPCDKCGRYVSKELRKLQHPQGGRYSTLRCKLHVDRKIYDAYMLLKTA